MTTRSTLQPTVLRGFLSLPLAFVAALLAMGALPLHAGPTVVPTAEGQIGAVPGLGDKVLPTTFESIRGQAGDLIFGGIQIFAAPPIQVPEFQFLTDSIHGMPDPVQQGATASLFNNVFKLAPASSRSRNLADDSDFVAFSFAVDGLTSQTMTVRIATFDETGSPLVNVPVADQILTLPDPTLNDTGVAVDNQGRVTVVYNEFPPVGAVQVKAQRLDALTGAIIDPDFLVTSGRGDVSVALLDPAGNRLIVPTIDGATIAGNIIDYSGAAPTVGPLFPISTTPGVVNINPAVAADPATGNSIVVWENFEDLPLDPVNIRGRRFDAMGNPIDGADFVVNSGTLNAQGQPDVAMNTDGVAAVVWAGDAAPGDELDVFLQVYGPDGMPIGAQVPVNTTTSGVQDQPKVRFMPENDSQGRPQVTVTWRDVGDADGNNARGTGTSYKCFAIEGLGDDPTAIFADGFESGDTSSWSDSQP